MMPSTWRAPQPVPPVLKWATARVMTSVRPRNRMRWWLIVPTSGVRFRQERVVGRVKTGNERVLPSTWHPQNEFERWDI